MRKRLTSISIVGSAALAACFGAGPAPQKSEATVVFVAPTPTGDICNNSRYVSSLQIGSTTGYGLFMPFVPPNTSQCTNGPQGADIEVMSFDLDGNNPQGTMVEPAGNSIAISPPFASNGSDVFWSANSQISSVSSGTQMLSPGGNGPNTFTVLSMAAGAGSIFLIGYSQFPGGYFPEPWDPQWPGNNMGGPGTGQGSAMFATVPLPFGSGAVVPQQQGSASSFYCDELKHCIVANPTDVYYMRRGDAASGYAAAIDDFDRTSKTIKQLDTIPFTLSQAATPVGLIATPTHVAWAVAMNGQQFNNVIPPGCWIYVHDVMNTASGGNLIFQSGSFSCLDLAMDDSFIYFTIIQSVQENDCGGCMEPIHGVGVGRVSLDGSTFESIKLDIHGQIYAGPRRVLLDGLTGTNLFLADPLLVAKVPRDSLAGQQDFQQ